MKRFDRVPTLRCIAVVLALSADFALGGCASREKLAVASGPVFPLNPDHWQATPADLAAPDAGN